MSNKTRFPIISTSITIPSAHRPSRHALTGLLALFVIIAPRPMAAEAPATAALSLKEALNQATVRNWDLIAARGDVDIATAQRLVAREFPNPTLSLSTTKIGADGHPNSTSQGNGLWDRSYDTIAAINQLIEVGGKRKARQESARASLLSAEARFADARRLLDHAVTTAYINALLADRNRQILSESSISLRQEAKIASTRLQAGDISPADRNQIEIAAERLELDAASAESSAKNARINLEILLAEPHPTGSINLADTLESLVEAGDATLSTTVQVGDAIAQRPDLKAASAAANKAEAELRLQKANRVPDPTFTVTYEHEPPDKPNSVGFGISLPLPLWNRNQGAIAAADATRRQSAAQVDKVRAQIHAEIESARITFESALKRWQRYQTEVIPKSKQVRESVAFAYQKGAASLLDLLTAQRTDNEVRLAGIQAAADAAAAQATLRAVIPTPPPPPPAPLKP